MDERTDERTLIIRQGMTGRYTFAALAAEMGVCDKTIRDKVNGDPGAISSHELNQMIQLFGWTFKDLWTAVTGERLTLADIYRTEI